MSKDTRAGRRRDQRPRMVRPKHHDTYERKRKSREGLVCETCGAVLDAGRWTWRAPPTRELSSGLCPACERIRDRYPAGTLRVPMALVRDAAELVRTIRKVEELEKAEHPLERLMDVERTDEAIVVTTTGVHLARRIAARLARRLHARPEIHYPEAEHRVVVEWPRSARS